MSFLNFFPGVHYVRALRHIGLDVFFPTEKNKLCFCLQAIYEFNIAFLIIKTN